MEHYVAVGRMGRCLCWSTSVDNFARHFVYAPLIAAFQHTYLFGHLSSLSLLLQLFAEVLDSFEDHLKG